MVNQEDRAVGKGASSAVNTRTNVRCFEKAACTYLKRGLLHELSSTYARASPFFPFVRHVKEMTLVEQDLCRAARKEAEAIKIIVQRRLTVDAFAEGSLINEVA